MEFNNYFFPKKHFVFIPKNETVKLLAAITKKM